MNIIVHIGAEKTGSTSLQAFLRINKDILLDKGIYSPTSIGDYNHVKLVTHCENQSFQKRIYQLVGVKNREEKAVWSKQLVSDFSEEMAGMPKTVETIVITSELFQTNLTQPDELHVLRNLLGTVSNNIKIIVYLRRQVDAAISLYSTHLRGGGTHEAPLMGSSGMQWRYNYKELLDLWGSVFGRDNIVPRLYEKKEMIDGNVVKDFCSHIGMLDLWEEFTKPMPQNAALSSVGQYLLYKANQMPVMKDGTRKQRLEFLAFLEENYSGKSVAPKYSDCLEFQGRYKSVNEQVARDWFDRDELFAEYADEKRSGGFEDIAEAEKQTALKNLDAYFASNRT